MSTDEVELSLAEAKELERAYHEGRYRFEFAGGPRVFRAGTIYRTILQPPQPPTMSGANVPDLPRFNRKARRKAEALARHRG